LIATHATSPKKKLKKKKGKKKPLQVSRFRKISDKPPIQAL
jgi:hypothetical protein